MSRKISQIAGGLAIAMALFHLATGLQLLPSLQQRGLHLGFALALVFLWFPLKKSKTENEMDRPMIVWIVDITLALVSLFLGAYIFVNYIMLSIISSGVTVLVFVLGICSIVFTLEATRRVLGLALPLVSIVALIYVMFGDRLPIAFAHSGSSIDKIAVRIGVTSTGIMGTTLGITATFVILFVIFGAFLDKSGAGAFFIDLSMSVVGKYRGGAAKVAIIASALFGTISGSPVANVVTTGVVTIPLVKKGGYNSVYAGAVESVASTGGMLMPPIMGAASFLIADYLQVPYRMVLLAGLIPAMLYFFSIFIAVDLMAAKTIQTDSAVDFNIDAKQLIREKGHLILPLLLLVYLLTVKGYSPAYSGFFAIISVPLVCLVRKDTRMTVKSILEALESGVRSSMVVITACACAGIVVGVIDMTGIGLRFSGLLIDLAGGNMFLLLVLTMVCSIVLGMGLPPVAAYIVLSVLAAPALINVGVNPMAAQMFIFYYGTLSSITPPMAVAAFSASGISGANPIKTGLMSVRLAIVAFIVPFMFVYGNELLFQGSFDRVLWAFVTSLLGVFALNVALEGFFKNAVNILSRALLLVGALLLIKTGGYTDLMGIGCLVIAAVVDRFINNKMSIES